MHLITIKEEENYDTVGVESNANPGDLKLLFEKLTIACLPEDIPNWDVRLKKYEPIKQEDDRGDNNKNAIRGRYHRVSISRNANPIYHEKNRLKMAQPRLNLYSELSRVHVERFGHPTLILTTGPANVQICGFVGMPRRKVIVTLVPMRNGVSISNVCRLTGQYGAVRNNLLQFEFKLTTDEQSLSNFGPIFLSWNEPNEQQLRFNIEVQMVVRQFINGRSEVMTCQSVIVDVSLPNGHALGHQHGLPAVPNSNQQPIQNMQNEFFDNTHHF